MKSRFLKQFLFVALATFSLNSCFLLVYNNEEDGKGMQARTFSSLKNMSSPTIGGKMFTSAWIQRSAEYKALCYQAYNVAKMRLDEELATKPSRPLAVITDIDETILDNTPNSVHQALQNKDYEDKSWDKWCDMAKAKALPGSLDFFNYAKSKGVEVFYVTNRTEANKKGTIENLKKLGFPNADSEHLLFREGSSSDKTKRRQKIEQFYKVVLYIGDNLGDFLNKYDSSSETARNKGLEYDKNKFGKSFIMLPNPNYGTWEKAMNGGYPSLSDKDKMLKTKLLETY